MHGDLLQHRRILIIGVNYWPEVTGIAPYTTGMAEHLARRGADVTVLTAMPSYPEWRVFEGYQGTLRQRRRENGVKVHRFRSYVPKRQSAARRGVYEVTYLAHSLTHRPLGLPDAVIGVVPSLSGGLLAKVEAMRYRCPYGLIVQDLMGQAAGQSGISGGSAVAGVTCRIEGHIARGASRVGVISEGFRAPLEELGVAAGRIMHLPNWSHITAPTESRDQTRVRLGWSRDSQVVLHTGNMGLKQGLEHVIETARLAASPLPRTRFVLMGNGSQRAALEAMASDVANVQIRGFVDDRDYPNVLAAADVLLVNERTSILDMSLPSKMTSYFSAGQPVVAAVHMDGTTAREVARAEAGIVVPAGDQQALLSALRCLGNDNELARTLGAAGVAYAAGELSSEARLAAIERFVAATIAERVPLDPPGIE